MQGHCLTYNQGAGVESVSSDSVPKGEVVILELTNRWEDRETLIACWFLNRSSILKGQEGG